MTTIITDGKVLLVDKRTTRINPTGYECNHCGEKTESHLDGGCKIRLLGRGSKERSRYWDGKEVALIASSGSSSLSQYILSIWPHKADLKVILRAISTITPNQDRPDGTTLMVLEDNTVIKLFVPKKSPITYTKVTELPTAIGSGSAYFNTYLKTFRIGWLDAFQMAVYKDPHSSNETYDYAHIYKNDQGRVRINTNYDTKFKSTIQETLLKAQRRMII